MTEPDDPTESTEQAVDGVGTTRRRILLGLGLAGSAGLGLAAGLVHPHSLHDLFDKHRALPEAPDALRSALAREYRLISGLTNSPLHDDPRMLAALTDHQAHAQVLEQVLARFRPSLSPTPVSTPTPEKGESAALSAAERAASAAASVESAVLSGSYSLLLASIAASEASHAELFT